jgi:hypothetical protein
MLMLKPLDLTGYTKPKRWCVPSAVAMVAGITLADATSLLARIGGKTYAELEGCWLDEAQLALGELGYVTREIDLPARYPRLTCGPTLSRFMREQQQAERFSPVLIGVHAHAMIAHMGSLFDNGTPKGAPYQCWPGLGRLVERAYVIARH